MVILLFGIFSLVRLFPTGFTTILYGRYVSMAQALAHAMQERAWSSAQNLPDVVMAFNPLTGIIEGLRSSLFERPFDWTVIGISAVSALMLCAAALIVFNRMEDDFADVIVAGGAEAPLSRRWSG